MDNLILEKIKQYHVATIRMLLYLDVLDIDNIFTINEIFELSYENIIETKCNFVFESVGYLLNFFDRKFIFDNYDIGKQNKKIIFDPKYLYVVTMQGMTTINILTDIGHEFILVYVNGKWYIVDSYFGIRNIEYREINIKNFSDMIETCHITFDLENWNNLFKCNETKGRTECFHCVIKIFGWENDLENNFKKLVFKSKNRLENENVGVSDDHLFLLDGELDVNFADNFLDSLLK
jgi:hypothetical protein